MPSALLVFGIALLLLAGAAYFGVTKSADAPLRLALGGNFQNVEMLAALLGLACLGLSFFGEVRV